MICNIYIMQAYEYDRILMRAYGNVLSCALALTSGIVYSISEARDRRASWCVLRLEAPHAIGVRCRLARSNQ